jgi:hypothetical protein
MRRSTLSVLAALTLVALLPSGASGQPTFESAGARALGMGGAFVAVADDASATHWNPAGLATGGPAGMTIGWHRFQSGNQSDAIRAGALRRGGTYTSLGGWPIGLSYGTFSLTGLSDGQDGIEVATLRTSHVGLTVLQTVVSGLVVGSTVRYLRGEVVTANAPGGTIGEALALTDGLEGRRRGTLDLDLGVMADMRRVRLGVTWKNLRSPTFGDVSTAAITLPRQVRLGLAVLPVDGLTLAMDIDLDTVDLRGDLRRVFALGGEGRISRRLAVRSGVRWSLEGSRRLLASAGLSMSVRPGLWLDGHFAQGRHDEGREFGVALRAGL